MLKATLKKPEKKSGYSKIGLNSGGTVNLAPFDFQTQSSSRRFRVGDWEYQLDVLAGQDEQVATLELSKYVPGTNTLKKREQFLIDRTDPKNQNSFKIWSFTVTLSDWK